MHVGLCAFMHLVAESGFTQHRQQLPHVRQSRTPAFPDDRERGDDLLAIGSRFGVEHGQPIIGLRDHRFQRIQYLGLHGRADAIALQIGGQHLLPLLLGLERFLALHEHQRVRTA